MKNIKNTETSSPHYWRKVNIYYTKYFESNWNNRNTWKRIKTIISIKNITTTIPHSIEFNNRTITDPTTMSNVFNSYFTSIAEKTKPNIKFSPLTFYRLPIHYKHKYILLNTDWQKWNSFYNIIIRFLQIIWPK